MTSYTYLKQAQADEITTTFTVGGADETLQISPVYNYYYVAGEATDQFVRIHVQLIHPNVYTYDIGFADELNGTYSGAFGVRVAEEGTVDAHRLTLNYAAISALIGSLGGPGETPSPFTIL